jgi:dolichyl-phosphate beta-glucosyltransferase
LIDNTINTPLNLPKSARGRFIHIKKVETTTGVFRQMTELTIVIPVFNEQAKVAADIRAASEFLKDNGIEGEIIIVDDGSTDNTLPTAHQNSTNYKNIKVINAGQHRGKGYAVRTGIMASTGEYVMFIDSGNCVSYSNILHGLEMLKNNRCDIAHGSRRLALSRIKIPQPWKRRITSWCFRFITKMLFGLPKNITDSQIGLKIYKGPVGRELYAQVKMEGFLFDIEVIEYAIKKALRIHEFPIEWTCDLDSRLGVRSDFIRTVWEMVLLKRFLRQIKTH